MNHIICLVSTVGPQIGFKLTLWLSRYFCFFSVAKLDDQSILHSVANILVNLTNAFDKPERNPELEKLAQFAKYHIPEQHPFDGEDYVKERVNTLVSTGVIEAMINAHKSESDATKESFSRVFFAITKEIEHRGKVVQQGGVKCLIELSKSGSKLGQLFAAHALARVGISLNPDQVSWQIWDKV